jgi:nucleophosmin 1
LDRENPTTGHIQKKVKLDEDEEEDGEEEEEDDDDFDAEETEEKVPVKKYIWDTPAKNAQKSKQNGKDLKPSIPRPSKNRKKSRVLQKTGKNS